MKDDKVPFVSLVDNTSVVVTVILSVLFLGEPFHWKLVAGTVLIIRDLLVVSIPQ